MNSAYKHLDSKLRVAELGVGQWLAVLAGAAASVAWGIYLSPLGPSLTLMTSVYIVALPVAATLFANLTEFDPWLLVRSALAWRRLEGRFVPGPGDGARGYLVRVEPQPDPMNAPSAESAQVDLKALWKEN